MHLLDLIFKVVVIATCATYLITHPTIYFFLIRVSNRFRKDYDGEEATEEFDEIYRGAYNVDAPEAEMAANVYPADGGLFDNSNFSPGDGLFTSSDVDSDTVSDLLYGIEAGVEE